MGIRGSQDAIHLGVSRKKIAGILGGKCDVPSSFPTAIPPQHSSDTYRLWSLTSPDKKRSGSAML